VIYAAGRGLDIKPFSKGIDTGCVVSLPVCSRTSADTRQYGRKLTALILGDTGTLEGTIIRVGATQGLLVDVACGEGGI
jgi:hypothetical protein